MQSVLELTSASDEGKTDKESMTILFLDDKTPSIKRLDPFSMSSVTGVFDSANINVTISRLDLHQSLLISLKGFKGRNETDSLLNMARTEASINQPVDSFLCL